ncbi:MAG: hypothetical protein ACO1OB_30300 [Archangium sp.]
MLEHLVRIRWLFRTVLGLAGVGALACAPPAPPACFTPRPQGTSTCALVDDVVVLDGNRALDELAQYCDSSCLDVTGAVVVDAVVGRRGILLLHRSQRTLLQQQ